MTTAAGNLLSTWRTRVTYQGALLAGLCALVTTALMLGAELTRAPIAEQARVDRLNNLRQVMPASTYDNDPLSDTLTLLDPQFSGAVTIFVGTRAGALSGVAFEATTVGYGGEMKLMIGIDAAGSITGLRVIAHKETPGLADGIEISRSDWILGFDGKSLGNTTAKQWAVKKDGGIFDQFTGATITPRAIVGSVRRYLMFFAAHRAQIDEFVKSLGPASGQTTGGESA